MDLIDRQVAIKTLKKGLPSEPLKSKYTEGITVGFGLAITWIEQLPAVQTCEDAVSRADVIELVKDSYYNLAESIEDTWAMVADVEKLPAVQPQQIVRCKDCINNRNCDIQYHAQAGDEFWCAAAERRTDE